MSIKLQGNAYSNFLVKSTPASTPTSTPANTSFKSAVFGNFPVDEFVFSSPEKVQIYPPKINIARVLLHRLTQGQIDAVNTSGILPKNAKFVDNEITGEPKLTWNLLDWSKGTHTLPTGYEMKNDILGFTHVVRTDTQAWWLKKN